MADQTKSASKVAMGAGAVGTFLIGMSVGQMVKPPTPVQFPPRDGVRLVLPVEAVDGDTVRFFWLVGPETGRLRGINAPESHGATKEQGVAAREFLNSKLPRVPAIATIHGREKYGRTLFDLEDAAGQSLSQLMIDAGHAVPFMKDR